MSMNMGYEHLLVVELKTDTHDRIGGLVLALPYIK